MKNIRVEELLEEDQKKEACKNPKCKEEIEALKREIARLKSKYEERCWCSVNIPARCGHK